MSFEYEIEKPRQFFLRMAVIFPCYLTLTGLIIWGLSDLSLMFAGKWL